jgi:CHAD domain-containing protein
MPQPVTPREYALANLRELDAAWSGVLDGDMESIHDARIATRRIRAALPFALGTPPRAANELRRIGRALGGVRELDAMYTLLTTLQEKVPQAAAAIAVLRREVTDQLNRQRRRMIKALDHDPRSLARAIEKGDPLARLSSIWRSWRHELRAETTRRVAEVRSALNRATAVYMPNRSHAARIELKKLRYTAEIAAVTGLMQDVGVLERLKKAQKLLGELHDLHVVAVSIEKTRFPHSASAESVSLASVIELESARIHRKYVRSRKRLRATCDRCVRALDVGAADVRAVSAAAIVAVPVIVSWYLSRGAEERVGMSNKEATTRIATSEVA